MMGTNPFGTSPPHPDVRTHKLISGFAILGKHLQAPSPSPRPPRPRHESLKRPTA